MHLVPPPPPPPVHLLPAGTQLLAGLGRSTVLADMDYETYSEAGYVRTEGGWESLPGFNAQKRGLKAVGVAAYSEHPSTEVLSLWYDLKDGTGPRHWAPGKPLPYDLFAYRGYIEAHNASFELWIWLNVCTVKYGWPQPNPLQFRCSMAKARAWCLPPSLGQAGDVLQLGIQKDKAGDGLIKRFCMPQRPTKKRPETRVHPHDDPESFAAFVAYNLTDIQAEAELSSRVPDLSPDEQAFRDCDVAINLRGVQVDTAAIEDCIHIIEAAFDTYNAELREITGGAVQAASELAKLAQWSGLSGWSEEDVDERMKNKERYAPTTVRAMEIRQIIGSAAVKKLYAMKYRATHAGRMHDLFGFHAARTGRANGDGPQPTNLPNSGPETNACKCGRHSVGSYCKWCGNTDGLKPVEWNATAAEDALRAISTRSLAVVEYYFGNAVAAVSGCLRGLYTVREGHDLISSDYSAIEAVVLAALAGEEWRMDVFRTHGKIYEASASKISGVPFETMMAAAGYDDLTKPKWWTAPMTGKHHPLRKKVGKVAELAYGYAGWINAAKVFGADEFMDDDEIKESIVAWREASPAVVEFWGGQDRGLPWLRGYRMERYGLEGMAINAVENPGTRYTYRSITYLMHGDVLYCILPSGRAIAYHQPRLSPSTRREGTLSLSFWGYNTNPKSGPPGWIKMDTYAGKLTENVVQAVACDILRHAIVKAEAAGYNVVMHVYDEITAEIPKGFGGIEEFESIMVDLPTWAAGWPIRAAGGWIGKRYRK